MGTTWVPLPRGYHFGYQTHRKGPETRAFTTLISPNFRELEGLSATHNPKVAGSNLAPGDSRKSMESEACERWSWR
jgi:hypothetical protein